MTRRTTIGLAVVFLGAAVVAGIQIDRAGYHAYIIHTGSMTGSYNTGDLVIDRPVTSAIRIGEVITFHHSGLSSDLVTHRVVSLHNGTIQTKGDANKIKDTWNIRPNQVEGVVATSIPKAGYVAYFFKQRAGIAAAMTGILALILLYGLFFATEVSTTSAQPETAKGRRKRGRHHSSDRFRLNGESDIHHVGRLSHGTLQATDDAPEVMDNANVQPDEVTSVVTTSIPKAGYPAYLFGQRSRDTAAVTGFLGLILLVGLLLDPTAKSMEAQRTKDQRKRARHHSLV